MADMEDDAGTQVLVELSACSTEDARAVFDALRGSFASDRGAGDVPHEESAKRPTIWSATFDVRGDRDAGRPRPLVAPVTADLQGGYLAVDRLRAALASAFDVHMVGTASGDQEREVQLRLETRVPAGR